MEVINAVDQSEAINFAMSDGPFAALIVDIELREITPDVLCTELHDLLGVRPTFFLGRPGAIKGRVSHEVFNSHEFNDELTKPTDREEFKEELILALKSSFESAKEEEFESAVEEIQPEDFIKMRLKNFFMYTQFGYDIFMEITKTKYVKIIVANKPYTATTLSSYAKKGVRHLYIKKDDQLKFLEEETLKCSKFLQKGGLKSADFHIVMLRSFSIIHQTLGTIGITPSAQSLCDTIVEKIIDYTQKKTSILSVLQAYPVIYSGSASKSLICAYISCRLAKARQWDSDTTLGKLIMASLLMDVKLPQEEMTHLSGAYDPDLQNFSEEDQKAYIQHPNEAIEFSDQFTNYPDISYLIEHHHETPNRKGFPNRPSASKLTALCAVFNICQYLAAFLDGEDLDDKNNFIKAVNSASKDYGVGVFKETLELLRNGLK